MKKTNAWLSLLLMLFLLAGCGTVSLETVPAGDSQANISLLSDTYTGAIPVESQLIIGTINLEGTDLAVDVDQAKNLLPLWKTLRSLENSDTSAAVEKEAALEQIQETMTSEQIQAIRDMQLTRQSMFEVMQKQGMAMFGNLGANSQTGTPPFQGGDFPMDGAIPSDGGGGQVFIQGGGPGEMPNDGGAPGAPPSGGGFVTGGGSNLSEEQIATLRAGRSENRGGGAFLIDVVIQFLEQKVNPTSNPTPAAP